MAELLGLLGVCCVFLLPAAILGIAWGGSWFIIHRHEQDLAKREPAVAHIFCHDLKSMDAMLGQRPPGIVMSEVTLGIDHFRGFLGQLKGILGGQINSYQVVLERARREVLTRLKEQAASLGYDAIANIRLDTADISGQANTRTKASYVTVVITGTGYNRRFVTGK